MSTGKYDLVSLSRLKKRLMRDSEDFNFLPFTPKLFNKLVFGRKSVAIQIPIELFKGLETMLGLYVGVVSANGKALAMYKDYGSLYDIWDRIFDHAESVRNVLMPRGKSKLNWQQFNCFNEDEKRLTSIPNYYDEFIINTISEIGFGIGVDDIRKEFDKSIGVLNILMQKISKSGKYKEKKIVVVIPTSIDISGKKFYNQMWTDFQQQFGDKFLYIPYSQEMEIVDRAYMAKVGDDNPIVSPMFDMEFYSNQGLNHRDVYIYMALNHQHDFREYVDVHRDDVVKEVDLNDGFI